LRSRTLLFCAVILLFALAGCRKETTESGTAGAPPAAAEPDRYPGQTAPGEPGVRAFVTGFLRARMRGNQPRARAFLSANALSQYAGGGEELLLNPPHATPRYGAWEIVSVKAAGNDAFTVQVRVHPAQGGDKGETDELLVVGPGNDVAGRQRPWIVRSVEHQ
jgi:hypothetical protein